MKKKVEAFRSVLAESIQSQEAKLSHHQRHSVLLPLAAVNGRRSAGEVNKRSLLEELKDSL